MSRTTIQNTESRKVASSRDYLIGKEVEKLIEAAKYSGRYGQCDALLITMLPSRASHERGDRIDLG